VIVVTKLLQHGADPNAPKESQTCLHMLAEKSRRIDDEKIHIWKLLAVLLEYGADSTICDSRRKLPFDYLVGTTAVFQWILYMMTTGGRYVYP